MIPEDESDFAENEGQPFEMAPNDLWMSTNAGGDPNPHQCSPRAVVCYLALRHLGAQKEFRISRKLIAQKMGVSKRTADGAVDELAEKGWLLITPTFRESGDRKQSANRYSILWDPIRSETDKRLIRHLEAKSAFESDMSERQKLNLVRDQAEAERRGVTITHLRAVRKGRLNAPVQDSASGEPTPSQETAPGTPLQNPAREPSQFSAGVPVQKTATQNPDLHTQTGETQTSLPHPSGEAGHVGPNGSQQLDMFEAAPAPEPRAPLSDEELFDRFWAAYPRKVGKQAARKAFTRACKRAAVGDVLAGTVRFASDPNLPPPEEKQFIPHPSTWLNEDRWEDEPLPPRRGRQNQAAPQQNSHEQWAEYTKNIERTDPTAWWDESKPKGGAA